LTLRLKYFSTQSLYEEGRYLRKLPHCPECNQTISFLQSFKNINPWKYKCPNCKVKIKASKYWKVLTILGFFLGGLIAGVAIYQEERNVWAKSDSLTFFLVIIITLLPLSYLSWLYVEFEPYNKNEETNTNL